MEWNEEKDDEEEKEVLTIHEDVMEMQNKCTREFDDNDQVTLMKCIVMMKKWCICLVKYEWWWWKLLMIFKVLFMNIENELWWVLVEEFYRWIGLSVNLMKTLGKRWELGV